MSKGVGRINDDAPRAKRPEWKYYCHFASPVNSHNIGETPTGFRIDLKYERTKGVLTTSPQDYEKDWIHHPALPNHLSTYEGISKARNDPKHYDDLRRERHLGHLEWFGIEGGCLTGGDWALVRSDAVVVFEGRVTLETKEEDIAEGFIFDMILRGHVDVRGSSSLDDAPKLFQSLRNGAPIDSPCPIQLSANFEGTQSEATWTSKEIRRRASHPWKYTRLMRGQFVAAGTATFGSEFGSPINFIDLDILEVVPPSET
jgi:hypothetical protein